MLTKRRRVVWSVLSVGLLAVLLGLAGDARATTLRRMDLSELVQRADRVVHARVLDTAVYWNQSGTKINTDTTFEILDEAKGRGPRQLTLTMLGGRIDPAEMIVDGTPAFAAGEEVLLFTTARPDGKKNLVGFSQGVMRIAVDEATGRQVALSATLGGVVLVDERGQRAERPTPRRFPLDTFLERIRGMTAQGQPAGRGIAQRPERRNGRER
jgi:hypothetical protein